MALERLEPVSVDLDKLRPARARPDLDGVTVPAVIDTFTTILEDVVILPEHVRRWLAPAVSHALRADIERYPALLEKDHCLGQQPLNAAEEAWS
jgi:hypothetical protein